MFDLSKIYNFLYNSYQEFLGLFRRALDFLFVKIYLGFTVFVNVLIWVSTFLFKNKLTENSIVLHFNVDFGVDLIGEPKQIFFIPVFGLAVLVFNFLFLLLLSKNDNFKFLAYILLVASLLVNIFLLLALGPIYLRNFT